MEEVWVNSAERFAFSLSLDGVDLVHANTGYASDDASQHHAHAKQRCVA